MKKMKGNLYKMHNCKFNNKKFSNKTKINSRNKIMKQISRMIRKATLEIKNVIAGRNINTKIVV